MRLAEILETRIPKLLANWPIAGGVVATIQGARTDQSNIQVQPFGFANLLTQSRTTTNHAFQIGSISKPMTAMVICQLQAEGRLSLDDKVTDLLPWLKLPGPSSTATVRHLLQHTSGLVSGLDYLADEKAHAVMLGQTSAGAFPGEKFHYSNSGYVLLGLIAESVSGECLSELTNRFLLEPAGMHSSRSRIRIEDKTRLAQGFIPWRDDQPWLPGDELIPSPILETTAGDGHVISTAPDMIRFLELVLNDGVAKDREVLPVGIIEDIYTDLAPGGEDVFTAGKHVPVKSSNYGLGVNVEQTNAGVQLTHGGGMVGYASFMLADLANDLGVVVLTNSNGDSPIAEYLAREVQAELLGLESGEPFELDPSVWQPTSKMLGRFASEIGEIEIEKIGNEVHILNSNGRGRIFRTFYDRFTTNHQDFRQDNLRFVTGEQGNAWTVGSKFFGSTPASESRKATLFASLTGRYRSYSPWFPSFTIFEREGNLYLIAISGVEAPSEEMLLIQLDDGSFQIGSEPWLPERLVFGPQVNGVASYAKRDTALYSRISE